MFRLENNRRTLRDCFFAAGLIGLVFLLQMITGAYEAELNAYPDEPAHYITGLMLDQFIRGGEYGNPVSFAESYYLHYPKVAIGHWPPLLYFVQTAWTLVFSPSRHAVIFLQAVLAGLLGFSIYRAGFRNLGYVALASAIGYLVIGRIAASNAMVMAESLLTLLMLLATVEFGTAVESNSARSIWMAGLYVFLAILTKGTGWALILVPGVIAVLFGRYGFLFHRTLVLMMVVLMMACLPWQLFTVGMVKNGFEAQQPSVGYALKAIPEIFRELVLHCGWVTLVLAGIGLYDQILSRKRKEVSGFWVAIFSSAIAQTALQLVVPSGMEFRKLIPMIPNLLLFAGAGVVYCSSKTTENYKPWVNSIGSLLLVFCLIPANLYPMKESAGFKAIAVDLNRVLADEAAILISSESFGEGAMITEFALLSPKPRIYVLRASKFLSSQLWSGQQYRVLFKDQQDIQRMLTQVPISYIVLDNRIAEIPLPHHRALKAYLEENSSDWELVQNHGSAKDSGIAIYRATGKTFNKSAKVKVDLKLMIGRELEN